MSKDNTGVGWTCGYIDEAIAVLNMPEPTWQECSSAVDSLERVRSMNKDLRQYCINADETIASLEHEMEALQSKIKSLEAHIEELEAEVAAAMDAMMPDETVSNTTHNKTLF